MIQHLNRTANGASDGFDLRCERQDQDWLTDFLHEKAPAELSESAFLRLLLKYFQGLPPEEQNHILKGSHRTKARPQLPMEVLPVSASVYR